jgi:putative transposase
VDGLEEALLADGRPELFNADLAVAVHERDLDGDPIVLREVIAIRMDGHGRASVNIFVERLWRRVKNEDIDLTVCLP